MLFTIAVLSMLSSVAASAVAPTEQGAVAAMNAPRQLEHLEVSPSPKPRPCADVSSKKKCKKSKAKGKCALQKIKEDCEKTCGVCGAPDPVAILQLELDEAQAKVGSQAKLLGTLAKLLKDSQAELANCQAKLG